MVNGLMTMVVLTSTTTKLDLVTGLVHAGPRTVATKSLLRPATRSGLLKRESAVEAEAEVDVLAREPAVHPAFELEKVEMVDEYSIKVATYKHTKSGAQVLSAQVADENKVFGIAFRTPVSDSTGVPHILEHSVLCGSRKYTSKEPFADLLKGSLATFLNAFTYPDRTCYPVASLNLKDFYNLVNVYLDAVLYPRAMTDTMVLDQEGWHYELTTPEDDLTLNGVVLNEMKGVYSTPDSLLYRASQQLTFPDTTYAKDSGGDPSVIPTLDFEQFSKFHQLYYHPANSRIFFYGDDDLEARLELLDSYLKDFDAPDANVAASEVETQKLIQEPRRAVVPYPANAEAQVNADGPEAAEKTHAVLLSWLLHEDPLSEVDEMALALLDHLLMGTPTATLHKALTESGLGAAIVGGGVSDSLKQATFGVGLKGVSAADVSKVEELVLETLRQASETGFAADAIEASLNTIEFQMREFNTGSFPRGLSVMLGILPRWLYGTGEPADALRFEAPLAELKAKLEDPQASYLRALLKTLLVDNKHVATVELRPDANLAAAQQEAEASTLAATKAAMSAADVEAVIEATRALKEAQLKEDSEEDKLTVPRVGLADLQRDITKIPIRIHQDDANFGAGPGSGKPTLVEHALPCAGVVYADVLLDVAEAGVALEDLPLLRVLEALLDEIGTRDADAVTLQRQIGSRTGGLSSALLFAQKARYSATAKTPVAADPLETVAHLAVRGKATTARAADLFDLVYAVLAEADLDGAKDKAVEVLRETKQTLETAFISSGNQFAGLRLGARNSLMGHIAETTQGVTYYRQVADLLQEATEDWPRLAAKLKTLRTKVLTQAGVVVNLTADEDALPDLRETAAKFVAKLPASPEMAQIEASVVVPWREAVELAPRRDEAFAITTQVNYVASGAKLFEPNEPINGACAVAARYLSRGFLWDNVRVVGGAYGGGCAFNPTTGTFAFSSYRDPNVQATLDIYAKAADALDLAAKEMSQEELDQAIVGAIGDLDSPMTSQQKGQKALTNYLTGVTDEMRQTYRDQVLATTRQDFANFATKLRAANFNAAIFGSREALDAANAPRADDAKITVEAP